MSVVGIGTRMSQSKIRSRCGLDSLLEGCLESGGIWVQHRDAVDAYGMPQNYAGWTCANNT